MSPSEAPRRAQILDAAERLLNHYGPGKTTIADIAREAGVGVGTVYLEFESKEAIVEALSNTQHKTVLAQMRKAAESEGACADRLRAMLDARVHALFGLCAGGAHARDLIHCVRPAVKAAEARFHEEEQALLVSLFREAARTGEFDVAKPERTARAVLLAYVSFSPPWVFAFPRADVERMLRTMHELVLNGLLRRKVAPKKTK
jgi:AcrR family transcriptional regulator